MTLTGGAPGTPTFQALAERAGWDMAHMAEQIEREDPHFVPREAEPPKAGLSLPPVLTPSAHTNRLPPASSAKAASPGRMLILSKLRAEFTCGVCMEVCVKPTTTSCGHNFCALCMARSARRCGMHCPLCRCELPRTSGEPVVNAAMWTAIKLLFPEESRELEAEHAREEQREREECLARPPCSPVDSLAAAEDDAEFVTDLRGMGSLALSDSDRQTIAELWAARQQLGRMSSRGHIFTEGSTDAEARISLGALYAALPPRLGRVGPPAAGSAAPLSGAPGAPAPPSNAGFFSANEVWRMQQANPQATPSAIYRVRTSDPQPDANRAGQPAAGVENGGGSGDHAAALGEPDQATMATNETMSATPAAAGSEDGRSAPAASRVGEVTEPSSEADDIMLMLHPASGPGIRRLLAMPTSPSF